MSRVWWTQAIALVALAGLGVRWLGDYRRHRHTDARSWLQRIRERRLSGLGLLLVGLLFQLAPFETSLGVRILLAAVTVGIGGCTVAVTWLALVAHRRYPGLMLDIDAPGGERQPDQDAG